MASRKRPRTPSGCSDNNNNNNNSKKKDTSSIELVPWKDVWELQRVGQALLSAADPAHDNDDAVLQALTCVQEWQRHAIKLPHAVEATAALATVLWRERQQQQHCGQQQHATTSSELRLAYAAAVVRAVNGLVDTLQQTRAVAMSMTLLSVHLGLPTWLVEIRHDATHNQMPSLAVLRLGATTLLDYFCHAYWKPLQAAHAARLDEIYHLLQDYEYKADQEALQKDKDLPVSDMFAPPPPPLSLAAEADETNDKKNKDKTKNSHRSNQSNNNDKEVDFMAMPSEDEKSEDESEHESSSLESSRLGTNVNMFALLMNPPKKKKKSKKDVKKKMKKTTPKRQKKPATPTMMALPNLGPLARRVTMTTPSPDLWHCFVTHLVWGRENDDDGGGGGTLLQQGCHARTQRKYHTLLTTVGRDFPGLMEALIVHLVDYALRHCHDDEAGGGGSTGLYAKAAVDWIKVLLSRRFLLSMIHAHSWCHSTKEEQLASAALLPFPLPLRALLERCQSLPEPPPVLAQSLSDILLQVIGEERAPVNELEHARAAPPSPHSPKVDATNDEEEKEKPVVSTKTSTTSSAALSLEDMESMLAQQPATQSAAPETTTLPPPLDSPVETPLSKDPPRVAPWTRCTSWEPCPIGSLPGYPS